MSLHAVGISNFTCPVRIPEKGGTMQQTVATKVDFVDEIWLGPA